MLIDKIIKETAQFFVFKGMTFFCTAASDGGTYNRQYMCIIFIQHRKTC